MSPASIAVTEPGEHKVRPYYSETQEPGASVAVLIERQGSIAIVTMSRREALNAFNTDQLNEMIERVIEVNDDPDVRCVVLTGEGERAFAAGADIKEMSSKGPQAAKAFGDLGHTVCRLIEGSSKPWIAAVNGYAFGGGCEISLACDIRIASENAVFAQPEVSLGIPPGWGGTQRLTRLVGRGMSAEMIFSGRWVKADEAKDIGIVNAVYPSAELLPRALELATTIANNAPLAVSGSKRAINLALDVPIDAGLEYEAQMFALTFGTADQQEGMAAFVEKRKAEFKGE